MPEKNEKHLESMESVRWVERKKERKEKSSWVKLKAFPTNVGWHNYLLIRSKPSKFFNLI